LSHFEAPELALNPVNVNKYELELEMNHHLKNTSRKSVENCCVTVWVRMFSIEQTTRQRKQREREKRERR